MAFDFNTKWGRTAQDAAPAAAKEATDNRSPLNDADRQALAEAVRLLEHTSLATRLTYVVGKQIEAAGSLVPAPARKAVSKAVEAALKAAVRVAVRGLDKKGAAASGESRHKRLAALAGAAGGAIGFAALPVELPVSTVIMLRAIADVARAEGEDLSDPATRLACLEVFALGGRRDDDDYMESGYFVVRGLLAKSVGEAAKFVASQGVASESAPVIVRLLSQIASRFGIVVTQKVAAQALPVIGALGGAGINYAFVDHFQGLARGHFTVRRLERRYGADVIRQEYDRLARAWGDHRDDAPRKRPEVTIDGVVNKS